MRPLTVEALKNALSYDPDTGVFIRKKSGGGIRAGEVAGVTDYTTGYRKIGVEGRQYYAHRLAWLYMTGRWPQAMVDHRNAIKTDNRWLNLRAATDYQNKLNQKIRKHNQSGWKGVKRHKECKSLRWDARIRFNKVEHYLGLFDCPVAAHLAYVVAADKLHGEFARAR